MIDQLVKMNDVPLAQQRVLIREDLNVPMRDNNIQDDTRLKRALPTIRYALEAGAKVMVMSHLGRPTAGEKNPEYSLSHLVKPLSQLLGCPVKLIDDYLDQEINLVGGEVALLENVRFNCGEMTCDATLSKQLAALCDVFVMDAFATAHRRQASTYGVAEYAKVACAGPLLIEEIIALTAALDHPQRPLVAIVGGAKVSSKMRVLNHLLNKVDKLIVGGGIANTFLAASGQPIGKSLYEADFVSDTKALIKKAQAQHVELPLPIDVVVASEFSQSALATNKLVSEVADTDLILDVGPKTVARYSEALANASTIVWNGPLGVCEFPAFAKGTHALAQQIATSEAYTVAGGGDTIAVINQFHLQQHISYICTGGGAFLEYLQSGTLPSIEILVKRAQQYVE